MKQLPKTWLFDNYWYIAGDVGALAEEWRPCDDITSLVALCASMLEPITPGGSLPKWADDDFLTPIAENAGQLLVQQGNIASAEHYYLVAKALAPTRVSVARELSDIYKDQRRWSEALVEQKRLVELAPGDAEARRWVSALSTAIDSGLSHQALDAILSEVVQLRAGQELILEEVAFQRDLFQQVADKQRRAMGRLEPVNRMAATPSASMPTWSISFMI